MVEVPVHYACFSLLALGYVYRDIHAFDYNSPSIVKTHHINNPESSDQNSFISRLRPLNVTSTKCQYCRRKT